MKFNTALSDQLSSLGFPKKLPEKCKKHGHRSRGAAEAQLRSILRRNLATNDKGDEKTLMVCKCGRVECKPHPWHVGHNPYVRREL